MDSKNKTQASAAEHFATASIFTPGTTSKSSSARAGQRQELRPVLVVGVGGTGGLAAQHVKNRIRDLTGGKDAAFMRSICFDTTNADDSLGRYDEGDFVNIGQLDFSSIVQNIDRYDHVKSWFPKDRLKPMQIGLGAMGIRHIGRLCYFQWRESSEVRDRLLKRMKELMSPSLKDKVGDLGTLGPVHIDQSSGIDIHIVGSGCGGTGSGLFLDMAYDLRILAKEVSGSARVFGHIVLPDAFEGVVPDQILPQIENNSHALLSEIDHFMHNGGWKVQYKGGLVESNEPPLDLVFLVGRNGMEGGVRTRREVVGMIGNVIATLTTTALGKHVMDSAVNLIPPILSRTDPIANRPCPYASYGIAIGSLDKDELVRQGVGLVAQGILDAVIGTESSTDSTTINLQVEGLIAEMQISIEELERSLPEVPAFMPQGATPKESELYRRGPHARAIKELVGEVAATVAPAVARRFKAGMDEVVSAKLRRMFTVASDRGFGPRREHSVRELAGFLQSLSQQLGAIAQRSEERMMGIAQESTTAQRHIQSLTVTMPPPDDWLQTYPALVRSIDEKAVWQRFYATIREAALGARVTAEHLAERIEELHSSLTTLRDHVHTHAQVPEEPDPPLVRIATTDQLLEVPAEKLTLPAAAFRRDIADLLDGFEIGTSELVEQLGSQLQTVTQRHVSNSLFTDGSELTLNSVLETLDRSQLEDKLKSMRRLAQPAVRCVEQYPKECLVNVGYASGDPRGAVERALPNIDVTFQIVKDKHDDLTCMRFLYGVPLWAIQGVRRWEDSAVEVQTMEGATHNLLDPSWADHIHSLVPKTGTFSEDLWLFSMFCHSGRISKEGFTFHIYGSRIDGVRDRAKMFATFREYLEGGKIARERAHREVEEFLVSGRTDEGVLRLLVDYLRILQGRLAKSAGGSVSREEVKLLREEVPVIKEYIARKEIDVELYQDQGETSAASADGERESELRDIWLFSVLTCAKKIHEENGELVLGSRSLGPVSDRGTCLNEFRQSLNEGPLSRGEVEELERDFLISGADQYASLDALGRHLTKLEELQRDTHDSGAREAIEREAGVVRDFIQSRKR